MGLSVSITKELKGFTLDASWEMGDETAVLFGFSGSGKSLTFQILAGLMAPDTGTIRANDTVLFNSARGIDLPPQARSFGYVFQDLALFPHMTVRENILFGAKGVADNEKNGRLADMVETFRLQGLEAKRPSEILGGQRQRVALARALIRRPFALLLDEPFSALDNPLRFEMWELIRRIRNEFDIPVAIITHDVFEAASLGDRLIVYSQGRVVQQGTPEDVFAAPATAEVERLVAPRNLFRTLAL